MGDAGPPGVEPGSGTGLPDKDNVGRLAGFGPRSHDGLHLAAEGGQRMGGLSELVKDAASLREGQQAPWHSQGRCIFEQFAEGRHCPRRHGGGCFPQRPTGGLFGANWMHRDQWQAKFGGELFQEGCPFFQGLQEMHFPCRLHSRNDETGETGPGADIHERGTTLRAIDDPQQLQRLRVVPAYRIPGGDTSGAAMRTGGADQREMPLEERQPAIAGLQAREQARQIVPIESHGLE